MRNSTLSLLGALIALLIGMVAPPHARADAHEAEPENAPKKVLIVISGNGKDGGRTAPGYEFDEFSSAYLVFGANGIEVDIASPTGGKVESDPFDPRDPINARVLADPKIMAKLENSLPLTDVTSDDYDAVFVVGGKGAMFDLHDNSHLQSIISSKYVDGGIVAAVCHGPAALVNVTLPDGSYLIDGKKVNGFTNVEEEMFGQRWMPDFPFLLEDMLVERGGAFEASPMMLSHVAIDGRLVTGQNPASTPHAAEAVVRLLGQEPGARPEGPKERTYALLKAVIEEDPDSLEAYEAKPANYNGSLIAMYGFFSAQTAQTRSEHEAAIALMSVDSPVSKRPKLRLQVAKSRSRLGDDKAAQEIVMQILEQDPKNEAAASFAAQLN